MRDPLAPIPSPLGPHGRTFWERASPPPRSEPTASRAAPQFDPTRLLRGELADPRGIDRRAAARPLLEDADAARARVPTRATVGHRELRALLKIAIPPNFRSWALVRSLSVAQGGLLVRLLDPLDPHMSAPERAAARAALFRGVPRTGRHGHGSMLATVGRCVLARRVVADLASWAARPEPRRSSQVPGQSPLAVEILVPRRSGVRVPGVLVPLADPQPDTLGIAVDPKPLNTLLAAVGAR